MGGAEGCCGGTDPADQAPCFIAAASRVHRGDGRYSARLLRGCRRCRTPPLGTVARCCRGEPGRFGQTPDHPCIPRLLIRGRVVCGVVVELGGGEDAAGCRPVSLSVLGVQFCHRRLGRGCVAGVSGRHARRLPAAVLHDGGQGDVGAGEGLGRADAQAVA